MLIMLKILLIMLCKMLKNFAAYYTQIMLTDIEQFPDIYPCIVCKLALL